MTSLPKSYLQLFLLIRMSRNSVINNDSKQVRRNFYTNVLTLFLNVVVGLYYTPYLVHQLGLLAYGIIPVALVINHYIGVLTHSLTGAFSRFYSVSYLKGNYCRASKDISTAILSVAACVLFLLPVLALLVIKVDDLFAIPAGYVIQAKWLFALTSFSFCLSIFSSALNVTMYSVNRLDYLNIP